MSKIIPQRLTVVDFIKCKFSEAEISPQEIAVILGETDTKQTKAVFAGTMKLPASWIFRMSKFADIDPAQFMQIYLRDYFPELEQAMHNCEGKMVVTERERSLLEAFRRVTGDIDPSVMVFENQQVVAVALA